MISFENQLNRESKLKFAKYPTMSILQFPPDWGFGNRILYYNNLIQLTNKHNQEWTCTEWKGHENFFGDLLGDQAGTGVGLEPCLGEKFFEWHSVSTRKVFILKERPFVEDNTVAIHFRGTDFNWWNPDAILDTDYYIDALKEIKDDISQVILFTDDATLSSFNAVKEYLEQENIKYTLGENSSDRNNYISDFSKMTECDYIISSPSTFCICAGFVGRHKKIIHSKKWLENRIKEDDKFWVDLYNGGNEDYSIWRLV